MVEEGRAARRPSGDPPPEEAGRKRRLAAARPPAARSSRKPPRAAEARRGRSAVELARQQREISVSEFFSKNRHLLGFDNPSKALLTTVREAVDNSLDACEEAGILPELKVEIYRLAEDRYRVVVDDNGPGIVRAQIPKIFGRLLYGSKFHSLKQSRGQQGIGISAAGMYGQLTTGKPVVVYTRTSPKAAARRMQILLEMKRNEPVVLTDEETIWDVEHGTRVEITLTGSYKRGQHSVDHYLEQTAIANPHLHLTYIDPRGEKVVYENATTSLPVEAREI